MLSHCLSNTYNLSNLTNITATVYYLDYENIILAVLPIVLLIFSYKLRSAVLSLLSLVVIVFMYALTLISSKVFFIYFLASLGAVYVSLRSK